MKELPTLPYLIFIPKTETQNIMETVRLKFIQIYKTNIPCLIEMEIRKPCNK